MTLDDVSRAPDAQSVRRARNQLLFREVNNRILDVTDRFAQTDETDFLCECSAPECTATAELTAEEYRAIRADPTCFVTAVGHCEPTIDRLAEPGARFWIVEALPGEPSRLAEESAIDRT